eukprot:351960-Chlamydomonas_euryale.AAC.5
MVDKNIEERRCDYAPLSLSRLDSERAPYFTFHSHDRLCALRCNKRAAYTLPAIERRLIPQYDPPAFLGPLALYNGAITADFHSAGAMPDSHAKLMTLSSLWAVCRPAFRQVASSWSPPCAA